MTAYDWSPDKNEGLKRVRGIAFEDVVFYIERGGLLDVREHPRKDRYPGQKMFVVNMGGYACLVPFVEDGSSIFLKTVIPSRKMTRRYLGGEAS